MNYDTVINSPNYTKRRRKVTKGAILHSTRGGAPLGAEYQATLNWFMNPASYVSAHVVISYAGEIASVIPDEWVAWHAKSYNQEWLGVELEQPNLGDLISPAQYQKLSEWCREMAEKYGFPLDVDHLVEHWQIDPQKSDIGPPFQIQQLMLLANYLGDQQRILTALDVLWSYAQKVRCLSEVSCLEMESAIVAVKEELGLQAPME